MDKSVAEMLHAQTMLMDSLANVTQIALVMVSLVLMPMNKKLVKTTVMKTLLALTLMVNSHALAMSMLPAQILMADSAGHVTMGSLVKVEYAMWISMSVISKIAFRRISTVKITLMLLHAFHFLVSKPSPMPMVNCLRKVLLAPFSATWRLLQR